MVLFFNQNSNAFEQLAVVAKNECLFCQCYFWRVPFQLVMETFVKIANLVFPLPEGSINFKNTDFDLVFYNLDNYNTQFINKLLLRDCFNANGELI